MSTATATTPSAAQLEQLSVDSIGFLSVDAVQKANSGHLGLPLGAAPMAYVLWTRFLQHNPANPQWFNRDRLAVEAGATQGWHRYIGEGGDVIGIDHFGVSALGPVLMREFGFTAENCCKRAQALLERDNA